MTGPVLLTFLSTFGTTSKSPHPSGLVPLSSQPRKPGWSVDLVWLFLSVDSWCASFTTRHYTVPFPIAQYSTSRRPPDPHPAIPQPAPTNQHWRTRPSQPAQHSTTQQQPFSVHQFPCATVHPGLQDFQSTNNLKKGTGARSTATLQGISVNLQVSTLWPSTFQLTAASTPNLITCQRNIRPLSSLLARLQNNKVCTIQPVLVHVWSSLGPGSVILVNHHLLDFISAVNPSALSLAFSGTSLPLPAPLRDPLCFLHTSTPHSPTAQPKLGRPPQRLCRNHLPRLRSPLRCNHTPVSFQLHAVPSPNLYHNRHYLFLLTDTRSSRYFRSAVPVSFSFFRDPAALSLIRPLENDRRRVTDRPLCVRLGLPPPGR